ncbi:carboxypeptidase-like regulatory domain-containing protein [Deinococcus sonorensis]|uniref:Carboxypeptidase-like regulatory domain-containing protein n=2 Tax=Deinococcus sonorensis TaxID=309891 RepID=A0AAU7U4U4_9DEIO
MNKAAVIGTMLVLALAACGGTTSPVNAGTGSGTPGKTGGDVGGGNPGGTGGGSTEAWRVKGTAVDTQGRPLEGTQVWMLPAVHAGVVEVHTDAKGEYETPELTDEPYQAYAWQKVSYHNQTFCLRLAAATSEQYKVFSPRDGVIRNFRWQLSGVMPDANRDNAYFGAEVRLMNGYWDDTNAVPLTAVVEVTLVPDGPLIDGSAGKTIVKTTTYDDGFVYDVPVGHYQVTATEVRPDGTRVPLVLNPVSGPERYRATLDFKAITGPCGGYGGSNGVERAFIHIARP